MKIKNPKKENFKIVLFKGNKIRKTIHNNEWWLVIEDVVLSLIDSADVKQYIQKIKQRDPELSKGWVQIVHTLDVPTEREWLIKKCQP